MLNQESACQESADANSAQAERSEHIAILNQEKTEESVAQRAEAAVQEAGAACPVKKVFEAVNGFTVDLDDDEADRLKAVPAIQSVETDQPLPLTPPVEIHPVINSNPESQETEASAQSSALEQEVRLENVFVGDVIESDESDLSAQADFSTSALPVYRNGTASTGETLTYGVKAVWGGADVSSQGNVGSGSYAFVIDSGVLDTTGDLLINKTWSKSWVSGEGAFSDGNGHGTHVAATIAALANGKGVVGVAPGAEVVSLKVFNSAGGGASYSTIIDAVNYATNIIKNNGLDETKCVINMSLGGGFSSGLDSAVKAAADQGIKFAIAAGNSGADADGFTPASAGDHANVYCVSAVNNNYQMASFSNWDDAGGGDDVDVAAPGVAVRSYYKGGKLADLSGTSMAAPHVAGLLLVGDVKKGDMVKANSAGYADPFALGVLKNQSTETGKGGNNSSTTRRMGGGARATNKEYQNQAAQAVVKDDGSVIAWGNSSYGGNSSSVQSKLNSGVEDVYSNYYSFAALKDDGSVVTWGNSSYGGNQSINNSNTAGLKSGVTDISSSSHAYAAIKDDGSVITWGYYYYGGNSSSVQSKLNSGVEDVYSNYASFAALKDDGSVVTWGDNYNGGNSSSVSSELSSGVVDIQSTYYAYAATKDDGSVVTWGSSSYGGNSRSVNRYLQSGVESITSNPYAFAALKKDGSVVSWGYRSSLGGTNRVEISSGAQKVVANDYAFAAVKDDGSVQAWGNYSHGGNTSVNGDSKNLESGVIDIAATSYAFAALKDDGSVETWGNSSYGADTRYVSNYLTSGVTEVISNRGAFAALKEDGSLVTWGNSYDGGINGIKFSEGVKEVTANQYSFVATMEDGSVKAWGSSYHGGNTSSNNSNTSGLQSGVVKASSVFDELSFDSRFGDPILAPINGTDADDYLAGERGNYIFEFKKGYDIMDYSTMSSPITLIRGGTVDKGRNGTDTFKDFADEIIGTETTRDWVDGLTGGGKIASLDVNLASETLKVSGIPGIGSAALNIKDFEHVAGSDTADKLVGSALGNKLYGNGGNDTIDGGSGSDDIQGGAGNDNLKGGTGKDSLTGGDGADVMDGGSGNDTISGGNGDDVMRASVGNDSYTFGSGNDTADYTDFYRDITLIKGGSVDKGGLGKDTFKDFTETVKATKRSNDWIDASGGSTASLDVSLKKQSLKLSGLPGVGTASINVQNFEHIKGSDKADRVEGDGNNNILIGNGGNDVMVASTGNDTYTFGSGSDTIDYSGMGQSVRLVRGGTVDKGSAGTDTFTDFYETIKASTGQGDWIDGITGGGQIASLNADLSANSLKLTGLPGVGSVSLKVENFENIDGSDTADRLKGDSNNNELKGNGGNDVMLASAGNDTYTFGSGSDTLDYSGLAQTITFKKGGSVDKGTSGNDTLKDFAETIVGSAEKGDWIDGDQGTVASLDANLSTQTLMVKGIPGKGNVSAKVVSFENVRGTKLDDVIVGDNKSNNLIGDSGNDTIKSGGGKDTIDAGSGNDIITVINANDGSTTVITGAGQDTITFTKTYYDSLSNSGAEALTITDFSAGKLGDLLDLSELFTDVAVGFDGSNPILNGYIDLVKDVDDVKLQFDGDGAFDTAFSAVTIALLKNTKRTDLDKTNFNPAFEIPPPTIQGTNRSERINGSDEGEWIYAYNGFDNVNAKGGDDRLYGGYGNDTLSGGAGDDELYGEMDDDTLLGGDGDDRLTAGDGADYLDGGNGSDTYIVDDERDTIKDTGTDSGIDTVIYRYVSDKYVMGDGIEKVVLPSFVSAKSLTVMGNQASNDISTGDSNDAVIAGAGDDIIYTASGNDKVEAGAGNDLIIGGDGAGDDVYDGGSGIDTVQYTSATDNITVDLSKGTATSTYGADKAGIGSDILSKIENVIGGNHNDQLIGDAADNTFTGEKGNDVIDGGSGRDTAVFKGTMGDYKINNSGSAIQITDKQDGRDGSDTLKSIESFSFSDFDADDLSGNIGLIKDGSGDFYAKDISSGELSSIKFSNSQVSTDTWQEWDLAAAETIDGTNEAINQHQNGDLYRWQLNADWNFTGAAFVDYNSADYEKAESDFGVDFNSDGVVGSAVTDLETAGSISLIKDGSGDFYAKDISSGELSSIKFSNSQVSTDTWQEWDLAAAETIDGTNEAINQHQNGDLYRWQLNADWNFTGAAFVDYNSADYEKAESDFGVDFNSDGVVGSAVTDLETAGSISLIKDGSGDFYAKDISSGELSSIKFSNSQVSTDTWQEWDLAAAETIDGTNEAINQHQNGDLYRWQLNADWNFTGAAFVDYNSADYEKAESDFGVDFNSDGVVGSAVTDLETAGSISLIKDGSGDFYAKDISSGELSSIKFSNSQVSTDTWQEWDLAAAETIDGTNEAINQHQNGDLYRWQLNADWNFTGAAFVDYNSADYEKAESDFGVDFNSDGVVGSAVTDLETAGSISLIKDGSGDFYAKDISSGELSSIKFSNSQVSTDTWQEWDLAAAETIDGTNEAINQHQNGDLYRWQLNADWNFTGAAFVDYNSADYEKAESDFGVDFNKDSIIGGGLLQASFNESIASSSIDSRTTSKISSTQSELTNSDLFDPEVLEAYGENGVTTSKTGSTSFAHSSDIDFSAMSSLSGFNLDSLVNTNLLA
ncbi:peptidase family S8 protein [Synechococcus sp. BIOS-E4-1]|nr:peptidase family S8 protein [Synechococcus sp. BIOS-E4-1]